MRRRLDTGWLGDHEHIQIRFTADSPTECAEIANEIAATYRTITIDAHTRKAAKLHEPVPDASRWVSVTRRATVPARPVYPGLLLEMEISGAAVGLGWFGVLLFKRTCPGTQRGKSRSDGATASRV